MSNVSFTEKLQELFDLYQSGALTKEEFDSLKFELMGLSGASNHNDLRNKGIKTVSEDILIVEPQITYVAPEIISQSKSLKSSFWHGKRETIKLEFADGRKGRIDYQLKENRYFFREKRDDVIYDYLVCYDTLSNCVNALHYFLMTGKVLKVGYLGSYT